MKKTTVTRKKYRTPKLTEYGSITDLTQASLEGNGDSVLENALSGTFT